MHARAEVFLNGLNGDQRRTLAVLQEVILHQVSQSSPKTSESLSKIEQCVKDGFEQFRNGFAQQVNRLLEKNPTSQFEDVYKELIQGIAQYRSHTDSHP